MSDGITIKEHLEACHKDELDDVEKYKTLANEARDHGHDCAAGILEDIAHDEKTHAEALHHILDREVF